MNKYHSKKKPILKFFLIGCGTITALVIAIIVWIAVSLFSGPGVMEMSPYHPFRSAEAKERYLKHYDMRAQKWPVISETLTVHTSYGRTFVRISGPVDAPPLVLLPSAAGTSLLWIPNIRTLSESYRVYAVDNIYDFGRSVYTRAFKSPDDFVSWLDELFTALEFGDNINLMGLSYGGWLTSQYALHFPERLNKIVLLAPAATILPLPGEWAWRGILAIIPHRYFLKSMTYWLFEDLVQKDEASRTLVEDMLDDAFIALRCFKFKMPVHPTVLEDEELQSIKVPTLFLVGENEKIYSAQKAIQRLNKVAPHIKAEVIHNAGHDLTIVQAEMVNRKVLEFLKQP
ncbi:Carboxylesterase YbfK [subsurface metagenome]